MISLPLVRLPRHERLKDQDKTGETKDISDKDEGNDDQAMANSRKEIREGNKMGGGGKAPGGSRD